MKRAGMKLAAPLVLLSLLAGCGQSGTDDGGWLGYGEGDYAYVGAPEAGWVTRIAVRRGEAVRIGTPLFTLENTSQAAARDAAEAAIAQAGGQLGQARATRELTRKALARQTGLLGSGATSQQSYDEAKSAYQVARTQVAAIEASENAAKAQLADASYQLSQRAIVARTAGRVEDIYFRQGEYAPATTPMIELLPPENVYVRFFVPEAQFAKVHMGEKVRIQCDGCGAGLTAHVSFIATQQEFTPPVIFSNENRDKLVFKVEARAPGGLRLHPGQPVRVTPL